jgi:hypothetical protein
MRLIAAVCALCGLVWSLPAVAAPAASAPATGPASQPASAPSAQAAALHAKLTAAYMDGDWDAVAQHLTAGGKLTMQRDMKADFDYVRSAMLECRPAWWAACKEGRKTPIRHNIGLAPLAATFDPQAKDALNLSFADNNRSVTLKWSADGLDSREKGEYGYLKGDAANLAVWSLLGLAQAYMMLDVESLTAQDEATKLRVQRFTMLRSNLAAIQCASPPSRRYALHIFLAAYLDKYSQGPLTGTRRAAGAMLMAEWMANPSAYPSLKLPKSLPAENAEKTLGGHLKFAITRSAGWTIAEDRAYRAAVARFLSSAGPAVAKSQQLTLPNKLAFSLDDDADARLRPQRDQWLKARFDEATKAAQ